MMELSEQDLILRAKSFEDHFTERKTSGDSKDWLKTVVAFANSAPTGYPGILYIGVKDTGEPESSVNLDSLQKTLSSRLELAYPAIYYLTKILTLDNKQVLAVIVPGSPDRPHFSGPAFIRDGSRSKVASESQFRELIAHRNSKTAEVLRWKGKSITYYVLVPGRAGAIPRERIVADCNQFYVTLSSSDSGQESIPLSRVELSFDNRNNRLILENHAPG
jgi:predicted HTH transcriptional regulator